jgi:hypothetical protein
MFCFLRNLRHATIPMVAVAMVLPLSGCGGSSGSSTPDNTLYSNTRSIGPAGDTVTTPQGITVTFPAGSLTTTTDVAVKVETVTETPSPNPAIQQASKAVALQFDTTALAPTGTVQVTVPYTADIDPTVDFIALGDTTTGAILAVTPAFDASAQTATFALKPSDFLYVETATRNAAFGKTGRKTAIATRAGAIAHIHSVFVAHTPKTTVPSRMDFYRYTAADANTSPDDDSWTKISPGNVGLTGPFVPGTQVALVVHGFLDSKSNMDNIAYYLKHLRKNDGSLAYADIWAADYEVRDHINNNGNLFADQATALLSGTNLVVDIYAHSMGGLVSRYAIEKRGLTAVKRLFTFDTPHFGVPLSFLQSAFAKGLVVFDNSSSRLVADLTSDGVRDLAQTSPFIQDLDNIDPRTAGPTQYLTFAGNRWDNYLPGTGNKPSFGSVMHAIYANEGGGSDDMDGIVPVSSSQYYYLAVKTAHDNWVHPSQRYYLNHGDMIGLYQNGVFNLDNDPVHPPLRSYILGTAIGNVDVN